MGQLLNWYKVILELQVTEGEMECFIRGGELQFCDSGSDDLILMWCGLLFRLVSTDSWMKSIFKKVLFTSCMLLGHV